MKYIIVLGDGMADEPIDLLGNRTPIEVANTPTMDLLASKGELGLASMIPEGMKPGSDTANLAVLGYYPKVYYSGRSPLEALSIGVDMKDTDVAIRCNFVTLSDDGLPYEEKIIIDHSSSEIETSDCEILLNDVKKYLENEMFKFYLGTSYRHCLIWDKGEVVELAQPHDILGKEIGNFLPKDENLRNMMKKSYEFLNNHPINVERAKKGLNKANSIWFWGAGTKPKLFPFYEKTGKKGAMISAVDLLKGIARGTNMQVIEVDGANGTLHTNYEGKAKAAINTLLEEGNDLVYVHVEAPDEMGHQGSIERKIKAIEYLDSEVIKPIKKAMDESKVDYRLMVLPDHPTPIACRTHTGDPVPYVIYDSRNELEFKRAYSEAEAKKTGNYLKEGYKLIDKLLEINEK